MGLCEIGDMHVVTKASAVWRVIVITEHLKCGPAGRCVECPGYYVDFRIMVLTQDPLRICTRGIEVPQRDRPESVRAFVMGKRPFNGQFRFAVRVYRPFWQILTERCLLWVAENRASR